MKRRLRIISLMLIVLFFTGCVREEAVLPSLTLPPIAQGADAPIGDAGLRQEHTVTLYLPSRDGQTLVALHETLMLSRDQHPAETVLRCLLAHGGNGRVQPLGGEVSLSLSGSNPVELCGEICTVNLSAGALQLSGQELYSAALAIAATLCELDGISYVTLLVAGNPIAMDVGGNLPLGALKSEVGQELPVLWEQLTARRTPVGELASATPLTATAALYFPLADGSGIVAEPRRIAFPGQHPQQQVIALLEALSNGADTLTGIANLPDYDDLQLFLPEVTDLESGGKRVTLSLRADAKERIASAGCDPACYFAAVTTTLTTFVPSLQQVCVLLGDGALTSLYGNGLGSILFPGAVQNRPKFSHALQKQTEVCFVGDGKLIAVALSMPYRSASSPRAVLLRMAQVGALPNGLTDADILGLAIESDTLLVHLSRRYGDVIRDSGWDQRLVAYAMVNTLGEMLHVRRVRFFFGGETADTLGGSLMWSGEFLVNQQLVTQ